MGIASLEVLFEEKQYAALEGGILEGCGKLFTKDLRIYVYPYLDPVTKALRTVDSAQVSPHVSSLYRHIVENGKVKQLDEYDEGALTIFSRDVLKRIKNEDSSWISMVPPAIAELIMKQRFFGYREPEAASLAWALSLDLASGVTKRTARGIQQSARFVTMTEQRSLRT